MYVTDKLKSRQASKAKSAFTLVEVVGAIAIMGLVFSGTILGYVQATKRAQWSGYSLAAQALAIQQIEQVRCARWDIYQNINECTNIALNNWTFANNVLTGYSWTNLDIPYSGTNNYITATNYVKISLIYINGNSNPPVQVRMVQVDAVWPFRWGGSTTYFTNTLLTYCAPDN